MENKKQRNYVSLSELIVALTEKMTDEQLKECVEGMQQESFIIKSQAKEIERLKNRVMELDALVIKSHEREIEQLKKLLGEKENDCVNLTGELVSMAAQRDRAIADIPHTCALCANGFHSAVGFDCDQAHYHGHSQGCLNWVWNKAEEV